MTDVIQFIVAKNADEEYKTATLFMQSYVANNFDSQYALLQLKKRADDEFKTFVETLKKNRETFKRKEEESRKKRVEEQTKRRKEQDKRANDEEAARRAEEQAQDTINGLPVVKLATVTSNGMEDVRNGLGLKPPLRKRVFADKRVSDALFNDEHRRAGLLHAWWGAQQDPVDEKAIVRGLSMAQVMDEEEDDVDLFGPPGQEGGEDDELFDDEASSSGQEPPPAPSSGPEGGEGPSDQDDELELFDSGEGEAPPPPPEEPKQILVTPLPSNVTGMASSTPVAPTEQEARTILDNHGLKNVADPQRVFADPIRADALLADNEVQNNPATSQADKEYSAIRTAHRIQSVEYDEDDNDLFSAEQSSE